MTKSKFNVTSRDANRDCLQRAINPIRNTEHLLSITYRTKVYNVLKTICIIK